MEKRKGDKSEESNEEKWVYDGSFDYKGRVPLRASTGAWKASFFVIMVEISERMSHYGLTMNLITYLTEVIHEDLKTAAKNVNTWIGVTTLMPLVGGFIADAYTGRFHMVQLSSVIYLTGLCVLTMTQYIPSLKSCHTQKCHRPRKIHEVVFFLALYCKSFGTGGYRPCLQSFGADQFDDGHLKEMKKKLSFFNWWNFGLCFAVLISSTVIVYVQDFVNWGVATLILTAFMAIAVITFCVGKPLYRYRKPEGNPLLPILQVLVAAIRKRDLCCPSNPALLYELQISDHSQGRLLRHTSRFRFLDKAAIIEEKYVELEVNPWRLTTVTRVEETKLVLNIVPIWLTLLASGACAAQGSTFYVKQAAATDLNIGNGFEIPPASLNAISAIGTLIGIPIYDKIFVPIMRKITGNERGISILCRINIGLTLSAIIMVLSALVEVKRLRMLENEILRTGETGQVTMSVYWLLPQNLLAGFADAFLMVGIQEYFYDEVPDSMRSLGLALYFSVFGIGNFLSNFIIVVVDHVTAKSGKSWIGKDINSSRLDNFYWMLAAISSLNVCVFLVISKRYTYKTVQRRTTESNGYKSDDESMKEATKV